VDSTGNLPTDASSETPVTLIGVVHLDVEAKAPLLNLLKTLQPDCIAVEISWFSIKFRTLHEKQWLGRLEKILCSLPEDKRNHFRIKLLKRQLTMPFEWEVAESFGNDAHIKVVPIDSGAISQQELPRWNEELLSQDNLLLATSEPDEPLDDYFVKHYKRAAYYLTRPNALPGAFLQAVFDKKWQKREKFLARRILDLASKNRKVVYIGGWMHLLDDHNVINLVHRLRHVLKDRFLITGTTVHKLQRSHTNA